MNIVFRVDSSMQIGAGHVMRCLTLAKELKKTANVQFICRNRKGHLINRIESEGFEVFRLNGEVLKHDIEKLSEVDWLGTTQEQDVLDKLQKKLVENQDSAIINEIVSREDIAEVVSKWTGIPVMSMLQSEREKLLLLERNKRLKHFVGGSRKEKHGQCMD